MAITDQDLSQYKSEGYLFKEVDGKIYIVKDDNQFLGIVDYNSSIDTIDEVISNAKKYPPKFQYNETNRDILGNYISEVEAATGKKIESAVFNDTECEFVIDGKTVKVPYADNESISLDNAKTAIELDLSTSLDSDDFINDENIDALVSHLDEKYGEGYDFRYEKTSDGKIKLILNDQELIELDKFYKVGEVVNAIDSYTKSKPEENSENPNRAPSRPVVNRPKIHINLSIANEIKDLYEKSLAELNQFYDLIDKSYITEKLKRYYNGLNDNSAELLVALSNYVSGISQTIDYCIQLYLSKDEKDYKELEGLCSDLWGSLAETHEAYKEAANMTRTDRMYNSLMETGELSTLNDEDYLDIMAESGEFFDSMYVESIEEFQSKLNVIYQNFKKETMPLIYNNLLEGQCAVYGVDPEMAKLAMVNEYATLMDDYNQEWIDEHIPKDVWDNAKTDYEKVLLLASYDVDNAIKYDYLEVAPDDYIHDSVYEDNFVFRLGLIINESLGYDVNVPPEDVWKSCYPTIQTVNVIKTMCTKDYSQMKVGDAIADASRQLKYIQMMTDYGLSNSALISNGESIANTLSLYEPTVKWYNALIGRGFDYKEFSIREQAIKWKCWADSFRNNDELKNDYLLYYNINNKTNYQSFDELAESMTAGRIHSGQYWINGGTLVYWGPANDYQEHEINFITEPADPLADDFKVTMGNLHDLDIFTETMNDEFFNWYANKRGVNALKKLTDDYLLNMDYSNNDLDFHVNANIYTNDAITGISADNLYTTFSSIAYALNDFSEHKITIDATKSNMAMATAQALETDDVTEQQLIDAKLYYYETVKKLNEDKLSPFDRSDKECEEGWDYLEEWQKKSLAKIYSLSPDLANNLIYNGLHNHVIQKLGYERAETRYNWMSGDVLSIFSEDIADIYKYTFGTAVTIGGGAFDGIMSSIENVVNVATADGIMNQNDYYRLHLAELLQKDDYLNIVYDISNGVGNMAIPLALAAFVPYIGSELSLAWTGLTTYGGELESMLQQGYDRETSIKVAVCKGVTAMFAEKMLGGITGIGENADKPLKIFSRLTKSKNKFARFLGKTLSNQFREVGEELFENYAGYGYHTLFTGETISGTQFLNESIETAYKTFLSTPFINLMGSGFQKMAPNVPHRVKLDDGTVITYTNAEMNQFIDSNGNVDQNAFFKFLFENDRINTKLLDARTVMERALGISTAYAEDTNNVSTNTIYDGEATIINVDEEGNCLIKTKYGEEIKVKEDQIGSYDLKMKIDEMNYQYEKTLVADVFNYRGEYDMILEACDAVGITPGEYIEMVKTRSYQMDETKLQAKIKVDNILRSKYMNPDNLTVKPGTRMGKLISPRVFNNQEWYGEGQSINLYGCVGFEMSAIPYLNGISDSSDGVAADLYHLYGLTYHGEEFSTKTDNGDKYDMYYVVGDLDVDTNKVYVRYSGTAQTGVDQNIYDANIETDAARLERLTGSTDVERMKGKDNNYKGQPDLGQGHTENLKGIGAHEFIASGSSVSNGYVLHISSDGGVKIAAIIDDNGKIHHLEKELSIDKYSDIENISNNSTYMREANNDGTYTLKTPLGDQSVSNLDEYIEITSGEKAVREQVPQRDTLKEFKYDASNKTYVFTYENGTKETIPFDQLSAEQKQAIFDGKYADSYKRAQNVYENSEFARSMTELQSDSIKLAKTLPYYSSEMDAHLQSYVLTQYACEVDNVVYDNAKKNYSGTDTKFKWVNSYHSNPDGSIVVDEICIEHADGTKSIVPYNYIIDGNLVRDKATSVVSDKLVGVLVQNEQMIDGYEMDPVFLMTALDTGIDTSDVVAHMPAELKSDWEQSMNKHYDLSTGKENTSGDNVVVFQADWALNTYSEKDSKGNPAKIGYPTGQWMFSIDSLRESLKASGKDVSKMTDVELAEYICELIAVPTGSYGTNVVMVTGNVDINTNNVSNNLAMGANNQYAAGGATASGGFEALSDGKMDISHVYDLNGIREVLINLDN